MLEMLTEDLWTATSHFKVFGLIALNGRMVIARLSGGGLWIHSPIALTEELRAEVAQLGPVEHIVAPSLFHHLFVGAWLEAFPEASVYAPTRLEKKQPTLKIDHRLSIQGETQVMPWSDEIDHVSLNGMPAVREHVFYHRASKTVILTDLCFYFEEARGFTKLYLKLNRVYGRMNTPLLFRSVIKDRAAFISSLEPLKAWEADRITLCHHAVITEGAQGHWQDFLESWMN